MYSKVLALIFPICIASAEGLEVQENALAEARGKGKYALLTHLAIVLAAKLGLQKILLGIALVVAVIIAMVVMAWVLAIVRYVPDFWPHDKTAGSPNYHDSYHLQTSNFFWDILIHFFYVVATKIFVLKIVYGIIFFVIASKAWHFVLWLIHYLKVKDKHKEVYVEYDHEPYHSHHDHQDHHDHHDHHESYVIDDDPYDHQPYGAYSSSYGRIDTRYSQKKKVYDADGSYSVGG